MYSFPLNEHEVILKKDLASMSMGNQAYSGALYLTSERLVFVGYLMDIRNKYLEEMSLWHIAEIKPAKSLLVIANALIVTTIQGRTMKFVVRNRDEWLAEIRQKLQEFS
ncbi:MAG: GRAM domain-containing protein [Negativicutes bacterium]|nr:GRAM domain-containing protein [Negativicutes bacterium]